MTAMKNTAAFATFAQSKGIGIVHRPILISRIERYPF